MRVLVSGWFSFEQMGATAGDLMARDVVTGWLDHSQIAYDVALAKPFTGGVDWRKTNPVEYSHVVFICGPFGNGEPITEFLDFFNKCRFIGLNLSMLDPLERWNPFDLLIERDSNQGSHPDLTFISEAEKVPLIGLILVEPQSEYKRKAMHREAHEAIMRLAESKQGALVRIDTRLDENKTGLRTAAEVESLIAGMDMVITTRLHGAVLAIKNGVPALAIDPIAGGAKVKAQADTIGWPVVFTADDLADEDLERAFDYCLMPEARHKTRECRDTAAGLLKDIQATFIAELDKQ